MNLFIFIAVDPGSPSRGPPSHAVPRLLVEPGDRRMLLWLDRAPAVRSVINNYAC